MLAESELVAILACPDCDSDLSDLTGCAKCGRRVSTADCRGRAVPVLTPTFRRRMVSFEVTSDTTNPEKVNLAEFLKFPPKAAVDGNDVYHLDHAHADQLRKLPKGALVFEAGCGGAQAREWIESLGLRYVGADISCDRIEDWLKVHRGPDILCDAHFLPVRSGVLDAVYAQCVLEHLANPICAMQEFHRALKPGGLLLSNAIFLEPWHDGSYFHHSPLGTHEVLRAAGFHIDYLWPEPKWMGFYSLMRMGNQATRSLSFLGQGLASLYNSGNRVRDLVRGKGIRSKDELIRDYAIMSGGFTFVARKPGPDIRPGERAAAERAHAQETLQLS